MLDWNLAGAYGLTCTYLYVHLQTVPAVRFTEFGMADIRDEIAAFETMQAQLEAEHMGEWILMRDRRVIGLFPSFEAAAAEGLLLFGRASYLVREIGAEPIKLPVSVIHHQYGG